MKPSIVARAALAEEFAEELFVACEQLVTGVKVGVSVPLELNIADSPLIVDVVWEQTKDKVASTLKTAAVERAIRFRAAGLFKQWLIRKGRIK